LRSLISLSALGPYPGSRLSFDLDPMLETLYPPGMAGARGRSHHASGSHWMSHDPFTLEDHGGRTQGNQRAGRSRAIMDQNPPLGRQQASVRAPASMGGAQAATSRIPAASVLPPAQAAVQGVPSPTGPTWHAPAPDPWLINRVLPTGMTTYEWVARLGMNMLGSTRHDVIDCLSMMWPVNDVT
jgi:hypothetical protein